ncbi:Helix-turn-helix domain-containing protein [Balnearium lithotrophicum]|uniref:Helix-turn-helix domain-containing protein n=1 Tax=Balnearium lithotrophicum TaxID=223788 RepID=A0A521CNM1_9BACT|nr:helix-turn-helix domain-containing protein [Balnearium lithotrophicum]SMO61047.1 Helix-turn-helix domain-containing protein [Balnearium lithotrophicum]
MKKRWLTTKEAEKYSNLCFKTLKKRYLEGLISAKKIGNKWLWDRESIDAFLGEDSLKEELLLHEVK